MLRNLCGMTDAVDNAADVAPTFAVPSLVNLRDIGGRTSSFGGVIRTGVVFRSTALADITDTDIDVLTSLQISAVYDLRTAAERERRPDRLPVGAKLVGLDVLADRPTGSVAGSLGDVVADRLPLRLTWETGVLSSICSPPTESSSRCRVQWPRTESCTQVSLTVMFRRSFTAPQARTGLVGPPRRCSCLPARPSSMSSTTTC